MSDRFCGEIYIGGKVPKSKIAGLINAINSQECSDSWGGSVVSLGDPEEDFDTAVENLEELTCGENNETYLSCSRGLIFLCDNEARNGLLDEISGYCNENNIGYHHFSAGYDEYNPEVQEFRPGWDEFDSYITDQDQNPLVNWRGVEQLLDALDSCDKKKTAVKILKIINMRQNLRSLLPKKVEPLEPFEIVEG
jgi:hypothetical protein